jgi:ATPase subunit of ABC transporter with duplicated ATPase domains
MISTTGLGLNFGKQILFENVNLRLKPGCVYGIIGANGTGKSTFLKLLAGEIQPSRGSIALSAGARLGWLRQDVFAFEDTSVLDTVLQGHAELWRVQVEKEALYAKPHLTDAEGERLGHLEGEFGELDGWSVLSLAGEMLEGLGIPTALHAAAMRELPGNLKVRALLAQALVGKPDVLLLDEPTNNLDLASIRWLEEFCNDYAGTIAVVSHDRHFLDAICTHIADVDYATITVYTGNYAYYTAASALARDQKLGDNAKKEKRIEELKAFVARFGANASKARQATSRQRELDKIELEDIRPTSRVFPRILFSEAKPLGKEAVSVEGAAKAFGARVLLRDFHARVGRGEKVAVIGGSGSGKTTLLKLLTGALAPDAGKIALGTTVELSVLPQDHKEALPQDTTPFAWLHNHAPRSGEGEIRSLLGRMLFSGDEAKKATSVLSGGETVRVLLARMMQERGNVLVLDEPTNHLDLESIQALNEALQKFEGTVFFSTHDRTFIESLATRVFAFTPAGLVDFQGPYADYVARHGLVLA